MKPIEVGDQEDIAQQPQTNTSQSTPVESSARKTTQQSKPMMLLSNIRDFVWELFVRECTIKMEDSKLDVNDTIFKLQDVRSMCEKKYDHLQLRIAGLTTDAREYVKSKNKTMAVLKLKERDMVKSEAGHYYSKIQNLNHQIHTIERQCIDMEIFGAYKLGNEQLKSLMNHFSIEDAEKLTEEMLEVNETAEDISQAISVDVTGDLVDMCELDKELELLELEINPQKSNTPQKMTNPQSLIAKKPKFQVNPESQQQQDEKEEDEGKIKM